MYGLNPLNSAALFTAAAAAAAAAAAFPKRCLRSIPIYRSLSATAGFGKRLPVELSESVKMLTCESAARGGFCDVYLIGTVHDSPKSCQEVRQLIRLIEPEVVFVELCPGRADYLIDQTGESNPSGGEFQVAYDEARKYSTKFILGDRAYDITVQRGCSKAHFWDIFASGFKGTSNTFNIMKDQKLKRGNVDADILNLAIREMTNLYPTWAEAYIHERDRYMSAKLLEIACKHNSVVAVVGEAHLSGIQKNWKQPVDMKQLLHVPIENKIILSSLRIGPVVAIIYGIYLFLNK